MFYKILFCFLLLSHLSHQQSLIEQFNQKIIEQAIDEVISGNTNNILNNAELVKLLITLQGGNVNNANTQQIIRNQLNQIVNNQTLNTIRLQEEQIVQQIVLGTRFQNMTTAQRQNELQNVVLNLYNYYLGDTDQQLSTSSLTYNQLIVNVEGLLGDSNSISNQLLKYQLQLLQSLNVDSSLLNNQTLSLLNNQALDVLSSAVNQQIRNQAQKQLELNSQSKSSLSFQNGNNVAPQEESKTPAILISIFVILFALTVGFIGYRIYKRRKEQQNTEQFGQRAQFGQVIQIGSTENINDIQMHDQQHQQKNDNLMQQMEHAKMTQNEYFEP